MWAKQRKPVCPKTDEATNRQNKDAIQSRKGWKKMNHWCMEATSHLWMEDGCGPPMAGWAESEGGLEGQESR